MATYGGRWGGKLGFAALGAALMLCHAPSARAASIDVGAADAVPGRSTTVAVTLRTMGAVIVGTQNRIGFDGAVFVAARPNGDPDCAVNPAIDKRATAFRFLPLGCTPGTDCAAVRAFVLAFDNATPLADGARLYTCRVTVAANAVPGDHVLSNDEWAAAGPSGEDVPAGGSDGVIHVHAAAVTIDLLGGSAPAGGHLSVIAHLRSGGAVVVGTKNRIDFAPPLAIAARDDGSPDCTVNPNIDKPASAFRFHPLDCSSGDCRAVAAVVLSFDDIGPIADGALLYSCRVNVAADAAPGTYRLHNSEATAADPTGGELPADGDDALVEVVDGAAIALGAEHVRTVAGQRIDMPVTLEVLTAAGSGVAGTANDLAFDAAAPIAATADGSPDCVVNPAIDKRGGGFRFLPSDCTPTVDCTGVRAIVLALDNADPIPDGAELYRCAVAVSDTATVGTYPLAVVAAAGADGSGADLAALGRDGAVEVICAGDCNGDGQVSIAELLRGVNISLADAATTVCPVFDVDSSGDVAVSEIIQAVNSALRGCTLAD